MILRKILSFDPGVENFAFSLLVYKKNRWDKSRHAKVRLFGKLKYTITSVISTNGVQKSASRFRKGMLRLIKMCNLDPKRDYIFIERYMSRPGSKVGMVSELTNIMIGVLLSTCVKLGIPIYMQPSSVWKNYYRIGYGTNNITSIFPVSFRVGYKTKRLENSKILSVHIREAIAMGAYCLEYYEGVKNPLNHLVKGQFGRNWDETQSRFQTI